jgi:hypothetical protein
VIGPDALHGWSGLALAYSSVQVPMLAGLLSRRASLRRLIASPLTAAPLTIAAGAGLALFPHGMLPWEVGATFCYALGFLAGRATADVGAGRAPPGSHVRGAAVEQRGRDRSSPSRQFSRQAAGERGITLAGQAIPAQDEAKHFKLIGTTGTGKSTAIQELVSGALARGDRAIIADPDCGYLRRFYDAGRGDVVLNPFDPRAMKWDLFGEIATGYDVEQLARSLIPDHEGADRSWRGYARTFFSAVTRQAHEAGIADVGELYRLLVVADTRELRTLVRGTPAQPFLDEHNVKMFDSIRSVTTSAVGALEHIAAQQAPGFSVRAWVRQQQPGVLFIPYKAGQIAALRGAISAWMRLAIFETMDREDAPGAAPPGAQQADAHRLWFVVDELDALGQIDGLKDALARLRKFGGRCVLGFQSIAQVSSTYGQGEAHTIVENCGNTLILRCSASEGGGTARFASQLIGEREVLRTTRSTSRRFTEFMGSKTESEHVAVEPAVLPAEIEQLPDLAGYLKLASSPLWRRAHLTLAAERNPGAAPTPTPAAARFAPLCAAVERAWRARRIDGGNAENTETAQRSAARDEHERE